MRGRSLVFVALFLFASYCPAQQEEVLGKKKDVWIKMLQGDKDPRKRRAAVIALGVIGPTQRDVGQAFAAALREDKDALVRHEVVTVVGGIKREELRDWVPRLADALKYDKSPAVRSAAAGVLGKLGELAKPVMSNLFAALKDEDPGTRAAVVDALGRIGEDAKAALPEMLPLLKDKELRVRLATVFALGRLGPDASSALPDVAAILASDPAPDARKEAARTIGHFGNAAKDAVPVLVKAVQSDESAEVRQQAILSLGKMGGEVKQALSALLNVLRTDRDKTVRLYVVRNLPAALGSDARELIKDFADRLAAEPDGEIRLAIIQELGALGLEAQAALPALRAAQRDIQVMVREAADAAILKIQAKKN